MESESLKQQFEKYGVVTLHRPSNVDDEATLRGIASAFWRFQPSFR
jgi:UDP-N-acetylglucosamine 2-epimerase (non-hydrolysing)